MNKEKVSFLLLQVKELSFANPFSYRREEIESEIADIFNYLVKLVDLLDIDLEEIALKKIDLNSKKYPIEKSKGKSLKYTEL